MNPQTFKEILFEGKELQKKYKSLYNKQSGNCLLGGLQTNHPTVPSHQNALRRFQIVQLKKYKPISHKKDSASYDLALRAQLKNRQIKSHRQNTIKVDRIQQQQLGLFQKSLGLKYLQKPNYLLQGDSIKSIKLTPKASLKAQFNSRMQHQTSLLNIENVAGKFIPSQFLGPKQYKRIYESQRKKIIDQKNRSIKKGIYLDFKQNLLQSSTQNILEKSCQQNDLSTFQSQQLQNGGQITLKSNIISFSNNFSVSMNRPYASQRKHFLKKVFQQQKQFQQKLQLEKRQALQIRKQVNKSYSKPFSPPQNISAQAYVIYQVTKKQSKYRRSLQSHEKKRYLNSYKIMAEFNSRTVVQIASLTKIMTFIVILQICQKFNKIPQNELIKIGNFEVSITGTTANLEKGQVYTLEQLFYGLMLPSGNDASLALAVWGGQVLLEFQGQENNKKRLCYERFIVQMNNKAEELMMEKTRYANSHGLMNLDNKSCAFDLALLSDYAMKKKKFRKVVETKVYQCQVKSDCQFSQQSLQKVSSVQEQPQMKDFYVSEQSSKPFDSSDDSTQNDSEPLSPVSFLRTTRFSKHIVWENTHSLLHDKPNLYKGIKTGITNSAGPCLASFVQYKERQFVIVVLNCKSMKLRFKDTQNLRKWAFQKEQILAD